MCIRDSPRWKRIWQLQELADMSVCSLKSELNEKVVYWWPKEGDSIKMTKHCLATRSAQPSYCRNHLKVVTTVWLTHRPKNQKIAKMESDDKNFLQPGIHTSKDSVLFLKFSPVKPEVRLTYSYFILSEDVHCLWAIHKSYVRITNNAGWFAKTFSIWIS